MTDTVRVNLGKTLSILVLLSMVSSAIWATAAAHSRLAAAERRADQQEQWIGQQTTRIEKLEAALGDIRITLARIDENIQQLRRENRVGR